MKGMGSVLGITVIILLLLIGMASSELTDDNESVSADQTASSVKAGDSAMVHMIQMATGPVLATETEDDFEGSWAFNTAGGYDEGGYDPYDVGYDPFDSGYDPFDTGYEPFGMGSGSYDPYDTGVVGGAILNPVSLPGSMFPTGSQMVNPGAGSGPGGYTNVIDAFAELFKKYPVNKKTPPVKTPVVPTIKQPSGFKCVLGICDCTGYQIYCQQNYVITQGDPGMWKARCCGDYYNPFGR